MGRLVCRRAWIMPAAASFLIAAGAHADPLSLEDCRRLALERNRSLRMAAEGVRLSQARVREAVAGYLPSIEAGAQVTTAEAVTRLEFPDPSTGGTLKLEADLSPDYVVELSVIQPVYTFGRLSNGYRQSREALELSRHRLEQATNDVLFAVTEAFYRSLAARDLARVSEEAVAQAEAHARAVRARFETGQASAFDRLRAEVRVHNLGPGLAAARRARETALLELKRLLGIPLSEPLEIEGDLDAAVVEPAGDEALETAHSRRPDLAARRDEEAIADAAVRLARSSDNPTLSIQAGYNLYSFDLEGDPLSADPWDDSYQANLVARWPLFDGFATHARVTQSRAALAQARAAREEFEETVAFEVKQALLALEESREILRSQESNRREAAEALRMAERSYAEGLLSSLDVQDAELALHEAKTNYTRALADHRIAEAGLRRAMGTIAAAR